MEKAVIEGVFIHPKGCPVCEGKQKVALLLRTGRHRKKQRTIPCPQCRDARSLFAFLKGLP